MIFTWHIFTQIVILVFSWTISYSYTSSYSDWKEVEKLAEEYPYVVAILDYRNEYMCSGFSITDRTIVTAGSCLATTPVYVALTAVLGDDIFGKNILNVEHSTAHSAFSCYISQTQPAETIMNSNIALIYVAANKLDYFINVAVIGDYGPLQLRKQKMAAVGLGELDIGTIVLQRQMYVQKTCVNPQWFYCVCGVELARESTYDNQFGEGGPVLLDGKVVAIAGAPCGAMIIPNSDVKYNIFTIVMQYRPWILDNQYNSTNLNTTRQHLKSRRSRNNCKSSAKVVLTYIVTLLSIGNLIN